MKKWIAWIMIALLALPLTAGAEEAGSAPLLYRVTGENGGTVYLLGTIHIGKEDMYPLSDAVYRAYEAAEILAVEADIYAYQQDLVAMTQTSLAMLYDPGDDASKHMSAANYGLAVNMLDYPETTLKKMRLAAWLSLAEEKVYDAAGLSEEYGVDMHLLKRAHEDGKQVDELEGINAQMEVLLGIPDGVADLQIMSDLTLKVILAQNYRTLLDVWRRGDAVTLRRMLEVDEESLSMLTPDMQAEYDAYISSMYHDRDLGFYRQVKDYLDQGKTVLFAVGAAHVVGTGGIVDQLTEAGYTVEEIGR